MKQTRKKLLAGLLVLALMLGLCACGGPKTPEEVIANVNENLAKVKSMTFGMTTEMTMQSFNETVDMTISMDGETTTEPAVVHADMNIDMGAFGSIAMEMYAEQSDSAAVTYINTLGQWMKEEVDLSEENGLIDAKGDMSTSLESAVELREIGTETIDGVEATRYDGVITKENLQKVLDSTGMLNELGDVLGMQDGLGDTAENTAELGDIPISIWVDKEAMMPVRYEMDMTELMQALMTQALAAELGEDADALGEDYLTISKVKVAMTVGGFDSVEAIVIPDEAKNAEPMS